MASFAAKSLLFYDSLTLFGHALLELLLVLHQSLHQLFVFESKDLNAVGAIADFTRQSRPGGASNRASYILNRYINYSNYCILSCQFCAFARKKRDADGFQFTVEEIVGKAREAAVRWGERWAL